MVVPGFDTREYYYFKSNLEKMDSSVIQRSKYISFLILLFAGNTYSIFTILWQYYYSIRYILIYANIVTKLSQGQSAGNNTSVINTSETTHKSIESISELSVNSENIKLITEHILTHWKPLTDEEFGHYLAGLIDGDGHIGIRVIAIAFNILDISLAYYIKERIGYDRVTKIRNKNAVILRISTREGIEKVINLTNGKLRVQYKMDNMKKNLTDCYKKNL
jgi:hypothetical protein